jgi:uncharacterized protein (TIGR02266 family)
VLGVTLVACGGALVFLALYRQVELVAALSPWPGAANLVARALQRRASRDVEIWAEAVLGVVLLVGAGGLLAARSAAPRKVAPSVSPAHQRELERERERSAKAEKEIVSLRAELRSLRAPPAPPPGPAPSVRVEAIPIATPRPPAPVVTTNGTANGLGVVESHVVESRIVLAETPAEPPPAVGAPIVSAPPARPSSPPRPSSYPELRHELRFTAHVEVDFESDSHFYTGLTENLSEGGLFIATYSPRPVGTEIDLTLRLPHSAESIRARGTVRWIREFSDSSDTVPGMGVRLSMNDGDLVRVRRFLSTRPPLFFDDD